MYYSYKLGRDGASETVLTAYALGKAYGYTKQSPRIQESASVGQIRSDHDERLYAEQRRPVHKGCHAEALHRSGN